MKMKFGVWVGNKKVEFHEKNMKDAIDFVADNYGYYFVKSIERIYPYQAKTGDDYFMNRAISNTVKHKHKMNRRGFRKH